MREFGASRGVRIPVALAGKAKTAAQFVAVLLLLVNLGTRTTQLGKLLCFF